MGLSDFLTNIVETKENHKNESLRTRYYRNDLRKTKIAVSSALNKLNYNVISESEEFNEIIVQNSSFHMMISLFKISAFETAIDVKVQTYTIVGRGKPKKIVVSFFDTLSKELNLKGVGMGK